MNTEKPNGARKNAPMTELFDRGAPGTEMFDAATPGGLVLEHVAGAGAGRKVRVKELLPGGVIRFGRDTGCQIRFDPEQDRRASARHAELRLEDGRLVLQDAGSSNGTFVNGRKVERHVLSPGDVIEFGTGGPQMRVSEVPGTAPAGGAGPTEFAGAAGGASARRGGGREAGAGERRASGKEGPGKRTVQLMIQEAVEKARQNPGTQFMNAVVGRATGESRRTTRKYAAWLVALVVVVAGGALAKVNIDQRELRGEMVAHIGGVEEMLRAQLVATQSSIVSLEEQMAVLEGRVDNAATREELEQLSGIVQAERQRARQLEQQIAEARTQIAEVDAKAVQALRNFRDVAARVENAVYMLAVHYPELGRVNPFCSSFAVRQDGVLYTNAHCNAAYDQLLSEARKHNVRAVPVAIRNGDPDAIFPVTARGSHPDYSRAGIDLAYLKLRTDGPLPQVIPMASADELASLGPGYEMAVYGYPGELMDTEPVATFLPGTIGRITEGNKLIQHSSLTSKGTSGSPILNLSGEVVGINHAGKLNQLLTVATDSRGRVLMARDGTPRMKVIGVPSSGRSFGIHGRYLAEWLESVD